jgi:hypothetical protein
MTQQQQSISTTVLFLLFCCIRFEFILGNSLPHTKANSFAFSVFFIFIYEHFTSISSQILTLNSNISDALDMESNGKLGF